MIKRIYIEITNVCNCSCSFCAKNRREPRFMSVDEFQYIIEQTKQITNYIYLHVQGEPLLHPELDQILTLCDNNHLQVQLVTNGTFLPSSRFILNHPCLRKLSVSLQSAPFQTTLSPEQYVNQVLEFMNQALKTNHIYCELRFWRSDQLSEDADRICLSRIQQSYPFQITNRKNSYQLSERLFISFANDFSWPKATAEARSTVNGTCLGARSQLAILSNGTVVPCCLDSQGSVVLGNIFQTPLKEILSGSRYQNLVQQFQTHQIKEPFCISCSYRHRFDQNS